MNRITIRWASVAFLVAVAVTLGASAYADLPSIICSFRMSGVTVPYARGIFARGFHTTDVYGIFYQSPNYNYLYKFHTSGSLVSRVRLPGAVKLGDADFTPESYSSGYFAVIDEASRDLKLYSTAGSFYSVIRTLPGDVVAYARGGHVTPRLYLGTRNGVISRYTTNWSFLNSFATAVPIADLAAGSGYRYAWGDYLEVGTRQAGEPIRVYFGYSGYLYDSFTLPGVRNCGAIGGGDSYWCLRDLGTEIWAYGVRIAALMEVQPASLGRIKALYK